MAKNLKIFMREELKQDIITEIPGIATFSDENGNPEPMTVRALGSEEVLRLRDMHHKRVMVRDNKGKPLMVNGQIQYIEEYDSAAISDEMIAESLVYPDLHSQEILAFYGVESAAKAVRKVFRKPEDYKYISEKVSEVSGLDPDPQEAVDEIKN